MFEKLVLWKIRYGVDSGILMLTKVLPSGSQNYQDSGIEHQGGVGRMNDIKIITVVYKF